MNQDEDIDIEQIINKIDKLETIMKILDSNMKRLDSNMNILDSKMDKILEILEKDCKKMTDHIDFIENVYDNVKSPFYYLMDKVNLLSNTRMLE